MGLDREVVVRTALGLLNEVGLEGLTLRGIGKALDVQAPALYWHFKNKQALLDEMATTMLRDLLTAADAPSPALPWESWMAESIRGLRQMLLRYRDGAKMFSGTYLTDDSLLASMELPLRKLTDAGFPLRDAVRGWSTLYSYTIGFTIEEQAVHPRPDQNDALYDLGRRAQRIDGGKFPLALAAGEEILSRFDDRFEHGMGLIIAGLGLQLSSGN